MTKSIANHTYRINSSSKILILRIINLSHISAAYFKLEYLTKILYTIYRVCTKSSYSAKYRKPCEDTS